MKIISSGYLEASQGIVHTIQSIQTTIGYDPNFNDDNGTLRKFISFLRIRYAHCDLNFYAYRYELQFIRSD